MYLIVITSRERTGGGMHSRAPFLETHNVTEYLNEVDFKAAAFRLLAAGTQFQAYSAQRLQLTSSVEIAVEK